MQEGWTQAFNEIETNIINSFPVIDKQIDVLNIIDFANNIIKINLWARQKFVLKVFYNLPLSDEEKKEIQWLKDNKGITILENYQYINFNELILNIGRRGSKSSMAALIATYETYKLLSLYNPQKFYGLIPGTAIYILHCAAEEEQAKGVQDYVRGFVKNTNWFDSYLDDMKEREIRFFTRFDKDTSYPKGTVRIFSLTSNSSSITGRTAKVVILDELARMLDTKGRLAGKEIYDALTPSVKTFKSEGKIIDISSPRAESGVFYDLSIKAPKVHEMLYFNYASWEFNEKLTYDDFKSEFEKDPEMASMEYGAKFGKVLNKAFDWTKIDKMVEWDRCTNFIGNKSYIYGITCDAATVNDRYGIAWGHSENRGADKYIIIDGIKYYESKKTKDNQGNINIEEVDLDMVDNFVIGLIKLLGSVSFIAYDQGKSTASIQKLQKLNYHAIETTFTNKYKETLYLDTKNILNQERCKICGKDEQGAINILMNEMKYIQRTVEGPMIKIGHPQHGPVTTDDLYDCVSNLIHLLLLEGSSTIMRPITMKPKILTTRVWG